MIFKTIVQATVNFKKINTMKMIRYIISGIISVLILTFSAEVSAQDNSERDKIEALNEMVKSEVFNVSGLIHTREIFNFEENGSRYFQVPHARIRINGKLDGGFSYNVHFDAAAASKVVDAFVGYKMSERANITIGIQKPGVSYEFLMPPHKVDFVTRSTVVSTLTSHRDIGVKLHGSLTDILNYTFGVYNGNGYGANDNNKFFYTGRLDLDKSREGKKLIIGVNASYGEHASRDLSSNLLTIDGERITYGGDMRYETERIIIASELLGAQMEYVGFTEADNVFGVHLTSGYKVTERSHVLLRYDHFESELLPAADQEKIVIGFNRYPTSNTGFKINYLLPLDDTAFSNHGLALNYYLSF